MSNRLKLKLYESVTISRLLHGVGAWKLDDKAVSSLRGWNARCLSRITGRSVRDETVAPTFDIISHIIVRRLRWLGVILRMGDDRLICRLAKKNMLPYGKHGLINDGCTQ